MSFALHVALKDGGVRHLFGHTVGQRAEFERMRDTWRDWPLNGYWLLNGASGPDRIVVGDNTDVTLVER